MQNLLLLHGALGSADQLKPLKELLRSHFHIHTLNFSGHGGKSFDEDFSIEKFTTELDNFIEDNNLTDLFIFGFSMGGYIALNCSRTNRNINSILTLGTKFNWSAETASHEVKMLNPAKVEAKIPAFAQTLKDRHHPQDWTKVMTQTAQLMIRLGDKPLLHDASLAEIQIPVKILRGSLDTMVTEEESKKVAMTLSKGSYQSIEDFKHPLEQVDLKVLQEEIRLFFNS